MKRIVHPEVTQEVTFEENKVHTWVIEDPSFFRALVQDLYGQINGERGKFVLSEDYTPLDMAKHLDLITQFVPFELNRKTLLGKICAAVEKEALNEENFAKTQALLAEIERYLDELLFLYPYDFEYEKLNMGALIKAVGPVVCDAYEREIERILDYLQLMRDFVGERIFVFINMRSYFSDGDMEAFFRDATARKFHLFLIDNHEYPHLSQECRLVVDRDLCEIYESPCI